MVAIASTWLKCTYCISSHKRSFYKKCTPCFHKMSNTVVIYAFNGIAQWWPLDELRLENETD